MTGQVLGEPPGEQRHQQEQPSTDEERGEDEGGEPDNSVAVAPRRGEQPGAGNGVGAKRANFHDITPQFAHQIVNHCQDDVTRFWIAEGGFWVEEFT